MPSDPLLAIHFANSRYAVRGRPQEGIGTPDDLFAWLREHLTALGSPSGTCGPFGSLSGTNGPYVPSTGDAAAAVVLRDAIRAVFGACVEGQQVPAPALGVINSAAAAAPVWPVLGPSLEIEERTDSEPLFAALGAIARAAMELLSGPLRADLRACRAPGCVKFFHKDHPRREWCCEHCGNRARVARHYRRKVSPGSS